MQAAGSRPQLLSSKLAGPSCLQPYRRPCLVTPSISCSQTQRSARHALRSILCSATGSGPGSSKPSPDDDEPPKTVVTYLEIILKRKQKQLEAKFKEMGMEGMDEALSRAASLPANPPYRLSSMIAETVERQGRCVLVFEIGRPTLDCTNADLTALAKRYVSAGADALAVRVDADTTPEGLKDLFAVVQAVRVPVLARDWYLHPLQVAEAKEAGAAGVIGIVTQVTGFKGTALMSTFSASIGLDCPIEVVNLKEVEDMAKVHCQFYGINLGVGLAVAMPGMASKITHGMLGNMPFGTISMVGVKSLDEAQRARASGADCLLIKRELLEPHAEDIHALAQQLAYLVSGDD